MRRDSYTMEDEPRERNEVVARHDMLNRLMKMNCVRVRITQCQ